MCHNTMSAWLPAAALSLTFIATPAAAQVSPEPLQQLRLDIDRDGEMDTVSVVINHRHQRVRVTVAYGNGRSATPLIVQYREGDEIWLAARDGAGDPLCAEPSHQRDGHHQRECSLAISHAPYPSFGFHHSRFGMVLFGYDDPAAHEARPASDTEAPLDSASSRGELVMFLPFEQFAE